MPTKKQTPVGKSQACILVDERIKKVVDARAKELNMSASDIYTVGAMTFLNNGNRPISREEIAAREMFSNLPEENEIYLKATADFLKGSVDQRKFSLLRAVLGRFFEQRVGKEKNGRSLQILPAA
jgi:hypothetical protein